MIKFIWLSPKDYYLTIANCQFHKFGDWFGVKVLYVIGNYALK